MTSSLLPPPVLHQPAQRPSHQKQRLGYAGDERPRTALFTRLVVVLGHESESIQDYLGDHVGDTQISYVVSTCYRTTNNIYSL
jgi:hypothetical protein